MKVNAINLAEFILTAYSDVNISPMKLQKLAYYTKVWSVVAGNNYIDAEFVKWEYGPVNCAIYDKYRDYSRAFIPDTPSGKIISLSQDQEEFIRFVLQGYIDQSAVSLSIQTHKEDPWIKTAKNNIISDEVIKNYYSKQNFAKNFDRNNYKEGRFFVLKTNSWYSFTMDMDSAEASFYESYPSYEDYVERTKKTDSDFDEFLKDIIASQDI